MKILVTGGHLTAALACIEYWQQKHPNIEVVFIGRTLSQKSTGQISREKEEVTQLGIKFYSINPPRWRARYWLDWITLALPSLWHSSRIISQEKPDVLLSFGSYLAVPVALAAFLQRVPILTHEQTVSLGRANWIIGLLAKMVATSKAIKLPRNWKSKSVIVGNPSRPSLKKSHTKPSWLPKSNSPILLVLGGSQGSHAINTIIFETANDITQLWQVVHQTGKKSREFSDIQEANSVKESLNYQNNYVPKEWLNAEELAWLLGHARAAISRAGANTVQEIIEAQLPTLFVPLPIARDNEQHLNIQPLVLSQAALELEQSNLSPKMLKSKLSFIHSNHNLMVNNFSKVQVLSSQDALKNITRLIFKTYQASTV